MTFRMPAEWATQDWIWIGFPAHGDLWEDNLVPAQEQIAAFANAVAETGQQVRLVVRDAATEMRAKDLVSGGGRVRAASLWRHLDARHRPADAAGWRAAPRAGFRLQRLGRQISAGRRSGDRAFAGRWRAGCPIHAPTGSWKAARSKAMAPGWW